MILSRAHNTAFIHIPKNGGSTVKQQLRSYDDYGAQFYRGHIEVPGVGMLNANHLPLRVLEGHFPRVFSDLIAVESFAVCRDPRDRFVSAMAQHVRSTLKSEPYRLESDILRAELVTVRRRLLDDPDCLSFEMAVFCRQVDFVQLDGIRIVKNLYRLEDIGQLLIDLGPRFGCRLDGDTVANPTVTYRFQSSENVLKWLKDAARRHLPTSLYIPVRDLAVRTFTRRGATEFREMILNDTQTRIFIDRFYAADAALHNSCVLGGDASRSSDPLV